MHVAALDEASSGGNAVDIGETHAGVPRAQGLRHLPAAGRRAAAPKRATAIYPPRRENIKNHPYSAEAHRRSGPRKDFGGGLCRCGSAIWMKGTRPLASSWSSTRPRKIGAKVLLDVLERKEDESG